MKSKKNLYILLPGVLIVWGLIAYKIVIGLNPNNEHPTSIKKMDVFKPIKLAQHNGFEISADYRDPFLGSLRNDRLPKAIKRIDPVQQENIVLPEIKYKGIFQPADHSKAVFLIEIDGRQEMFKMKETHQEVKLLSGDEEKISIKYKKEKKTYFLKN